MVPLYISPALPLALGQIHPAINKGWLKLKTQYVTSSLEASREEVTYSVVQEEVKADGTICVRNLKISEKLQNQIKKNLLFTPVLTLNIQTCQ